MNDHDRSIHLSPVQVVASALASVTAAVLASFFGVAGTVIGAGVVSVAASIGSALYAYWIRSTRRAIGTIPSAFKQTGFPSIPPPPGPARAGGWRADLAGRIEALWSSVVRVGHSLRWRNIAVATVVVFVAAMGTVTAVEAVAKKPLSRIVAGSSSSSGSTSIGGLVSGGESSKSTPTSPSDTPDTTTTAPQASASQATTPEHPSPTTTTSTPPSTTTTTPTTITPIPTRTP